MEAYKFPIPSVQIGALLPMIIVALTGIAALVVELLRPKKTNDGVINVTAGGLALAAVSIVSQISGLEYTTMGEMVTWDRFGACAQLFIVVSALIAVMFSEAYLREKRIPFAEFYPLITWSAVGAMMMATSTHLLIIFLGVEILSVSLYVMAGLSRREERSEESALKYFLLGAFASGFLLYGIAMIYGGTGSLSLDAVAGAWIKHTPTTEGIVLFGLALILIGLGFKSSLVPFHQWTPDVYQGAPTNVAAFMATGAKIGAFAALFRVLEAFAGMTHFTQPLLLFVATLTMCVGNLAALRQHDYKRLLGYSSIAHAGYVVAAMAVNLPSIRSGMDTILWYMFSYAAMTLGAFAVLSYVARQGAESTRVESLRGLSKKSPFLTFCLLLFVCSLAGFPLTGGFLAKFLVFRDVLHHGYVWLAVVVALNSIVSLLYYYRIIQSAMSPAAVDEPTPAAKPQVGLLGATAVCATIVVGGFVFYQPIVSLLGQK